MPIGLCLLFFTSACAEKPSSYFPLETGITWEYNATMTTMNGTEHQKYIIANIPKKIIAGQKVSIQRTLAGNELVYSENDSGVFQLGYVRAGDPEKTFISSKNYLFRYPLKPGVTWQNSVNTLALRNGGPRGVIIKEEVPVQVRLVSVSDNVRVPAGTFTRCLRIERVGEIHIVAGKYQYIPETSVTIKDTAWYAPNVGLVKSVRIEETQYKLLDRGEYHLELYAMKIK